MINDRYANDFLKNMIILNSELLTHNLIFNILHVFIRKM